MWNLYSKLLSEYRNGLMGYQAIAIIAQAGLGSAAALLCLMGGNDWLQMCQLFLVTAACMGYNGAILSQQRTKVSFNLLIFSVLVSLGVIFLNL